MHNANKDTVSKDTVSEGEGEGEAACEKTDVSSSAAASDLEDKAENLELLTLVANGNLKEVSKILDTNSSIVDRCATITLDSESGPFLLKNATPLDVAICKLDGAMLNLFAKKCSTLELTTAAKNSVKHIALENDLRLLFSVNQIIKRCFNDYILFKLNNIIKGLESDNWIQKDWVFLYRRLQLPNKWLNALLDQWSQKTHVFSSSFISLFISKNFLMSEVREQLLSLGFRVNTKGRGAPKRITKILTTSLQQLNDGLNHGYSCIDSKTTLLTEFYHNLGLDISALLGIDKPKTASVFDPYAYAEYGFELVMPYEKDHEAKLGPVRK